MLNKPFKINKSTPMSEKETKYKTWFCDNKEAIQHFLEYSKNV